MNKKELLNQINIFMNAINRDYMNGEITKTKGEFMLFEVTELKNQLLQDDNILNTVIKFDTMKTTYLIMK